MIISLISHLMKPKRVIFAFNGLNIQLGFRRKVLRQIIIQRIQKVIITNN